MITLKNETKGAYYNAIKDILKKYPGYTAQILSYGDIVCEYSIATNSEKGIIPTKLDGDMIYIGDYAERIGFCYKNITFLEFNEEEGLQVYLKNESHFSLTFI